MIDDLPEGWTVAQVSQLASRVQYGTSAKTINEPRNSIPVLRMGNIVNGRLRFESLRYLPADHDEFPELFLQPGDLLFNRTNSPELVGKTAVFDVQDPTPCSFASYLIRIRLYDYQPALLAAFINSSRGREWIRSCVVQQVGQANVSGGKLKELEVPVPPLNEQRRIVAKLEDLLARSRRAKDALDAIPPLLEKLRQSILASAFRGDLTADWRAKNPDVEPAEELLKRIRIERRKKWEETELAKLRAKGKAPADDRWKAKYKEPEPVDASELPELPEGWCWASLADVSESVDPNPSHRYPEYESGIIPLLSTREMVGTDEWKTQYAALVSEETWADQQRRCRFSADDIVIARKGRLGLARRPPLLERYAFSHTVFVIKCEPLMHSDFVLWKLRQHSAVEWLELEMNSNTGVPTLGKATMELLPIPLPPAGEQVEAVRLLAAQLSRLRELDPSMHKGRLLLANLQQALLRKAFRGELVEQDPSDEPASLMLERLAADREPVQPPSAKTERSPVQKTRA